MSNIHDPDSKEVQNLLDLVEQGSVESVAKLLKTDSEWANAGMDGGSRPLHRARNREMAELLIKYGADVNAKGVDDESPLHHAAMEGHADVVPALVAAGADLNALDERGCTPLDWATRDPFEGQTVIKLLLDAGANYDIIAAATGGDLARVKAILKKDPQAVMNAPSAEFLLTGPLGGFWPQENREPILKLLLANKPRATKKEILTFAESCESQGQDRLAAILIKYAGTMQ